MRFDIQTLSLLVAVSSLVFAFATVTVARMIPSERHLRDWTVGAGLAALSTLLVGLRGSVPDLISVSLANACLVFGFGFLYVASRGLLRRPRGGKGVWLGGCATVALQIWFTVVQPNIAARVVILSLFTTPLLLLIAFEFWAYDRRVGPSALRTAIRVTMLVSFFGALLFALRALNVLGTAAPGNYTVSGSALLIAPYIWAILFNVWFSIAVTLLVSSHLLDDLGKARDAAEATTVAKSQFLANMSHEIRTPMNAILGLLRLMRSTELTQRQRDYTEKTEAAAKSLLGLLNDILDFSKVDAGKMTLESEPFRLDSLLRDLSVLLSATVGSKNLEILFDIDPSLPEVLLGDALRLQQVLVNLGGNAVKFTLEGQVVLGMHVRSRTPHSIAVEFSVKDSGIGIAPEHQGHIFSGFSQAEASTTRKFGGTGLGLAISQRLVELMGGNIQLVSALGKGSTFSFCLTLPLVQPAPLAPTFEMQPLPEVRQVMVVDDNALAGQLALRMVESLRWSGKWAPGGAQALELVRRELLGSPRTFPYTVIFMDWQMPGMDGWETVHKIHALARESGCPRPSIIMLSANGRENLAYRSEEEQLLIDGFLTKPVTAAMLREAVAMAAGLPAAGRLPSGGSSKRQLAGMRILVVEDNLINQQVAEELLSAQGAHVSLASNGKLGVEAVAAAAPQFDVVLMDIQMPVLDGYAATGLIRNDLGLHKLPVIAMTANAMDSDREACLAAGMNAHVGKPFDMDSLVALLVRVTGFLPENNALAASDFPQEAATDIRDIAGLEIKKALSRMSNMRSLYARTARDFLPILGTVVEQLQRLQQADKRPEILALLHTLKGNAGTLGADALAHEVERIEAQCKADDWDILQSDAVPDLADLVRATRAALQKALDQLEPMGTVSGTDLAHPAGAATLLALQELKVLLADSNLEALQRFAELRSTLANLPPAACSRLEDALQNLDLGQAHVVCTELMEQLAADARQEG